MVVDQVKASMLEKLSEMRQAIMREGELEKQLNEEKKKEKEKFREARIIAANYYTPELIEKIYEQSVSILKVKDFDPEVYKERFSDIEKITLSDIEFLNDKQAEIQKALKMLSEKNDVRKEYKPLIDFTNMVLGRRP